MICFIFSILCSHKLVLLFRPLQFIQQLLLMFGIPQFLFLRGALTVSVVQSKQLFSSDNIRLFVQYLMGWPKVNTYPSFSCLFSPFPPSPPPALVSWGCICLAASLGPRGTETPCQTGRTLTLFSGP